MTHDPLPATSKPGLDDLLTSMGITREQMMGMSADDLFAAATQWQDKALIAETEAERFVLPAEFLVDLQGRPEGLRSRN